MVNEAGIPAVANERPDPDAVDREPQVNAGNTVAVNGLPATAAVEDISRSDGIAAAEMPFLAQVRATAALPDVSRYCNLMSYSVLLDNFTVAAFETPAGATFHKLMMY